MRPARTLEKKRSLDGPWPKRCLKSLRQKESRSADASIYLAVVVDTHDIGRISAVGHTQSASQRR